MWLISRMVEMKNQGRSALELAVPASRVDGVTEDTAIHRV